MGKPLNLNHPVTLNEKIQWLKIHDHNPLYTQLVDKYRAKDYVQSLLGEEYIIKTIGVYSSFDEIDFDRLPPRFVIKCTHDSGGLIICRDKSKLDINDAKEKICSSLRTNYYWSGREWPYKNVTPKILVEEYMEDFNNPGDIIDYKFYCFYGKCDLVLTCFDRKSGHTKYYFFDRNWGLQRLNKMGKEAPEGFTIPKPQNIDKMFEIAEILSTDCHAPFVRIDLYDINNHIYFGEYTFYTQGGFDTGRLYETDISLGNKLNLDDMR